MTVTLILWPLTPPVLLTCEIHAWNPFVIGIVQHAEAKGLLSSVPIVSS